MSDAVNANPEAGASTESQQQDFDAAERLERLLGQVEPEQASQTGEQSAANEESASQAASESPSGEQSEQAKDNAGEKVYTVKVNGQEIEVPESELIAGYQRQRDYSIKTEQLSEQRRAADAETQRAQTDRANLARQIEAYLTLPMQVQPPDPSMIENDPVGYLRAQQAYEQEVFKRQQGQYQLQQIQQQMQAEHTQQMQENLKGEQAKLFEAIPEWKNADTFKAERQEMRDFLTNAGFNSDEINGISDHRAVTLARKAMLYDRAVAQANAAAKQVKQAPPKVERPGAVTASDTRANDGRSRAMQSLKKTGSVEDAAMAFMGVLGGNQ